MIVSPGNGERPPTAPELRSYRSAVRSEGPDLLISWLPQSANSPALSMKLPASAILGNTFKPKLRAGHIRYPGSRDARGTGRIRRGTPRVGDAGNVGDGDSPDSRGEGTRRRCPVRGHDLRAASRDRRVSYRMFARPCCRSDTPENGGKQSTSTGFVVIGLAETEVMRVASWAISPVLVLFGVAAVMAALVGWPFLKCALMGAQQRITSRDVIGLGGSALFGLALATILLLSIAAYARVSADVSAQLASLANSIDSHFEEEIRRAANQARAMTDALRGMPCVSKSAVDDAIQGRLYAPTKDVKLTDPYWEITSRSTNKRDLPVVEDGYDLYSGFSLLDANGFQRVKAAGSQANNRQMLVDERTFQQVVADRGLWSVAACPDSCSSNHAGPGPVAASGGIGAVHRHSKAARRDAGDSDALGHRPCAAARFRVRGSQSGGAGPVPLGFAAEPSRESLARDRWQRATPIAPIRPQ